MLDDGFDDQQVGKENNLTVSSKYQLVRAACCSIVVVKRRHELAFLCRETEVSSRKSLPKEQAGRRLLRETKSQVRSILLVTPWVSAL